MATIPTDVIHTCILHRLPVKSLTRFKSVSKTWQTIISSREFIHLHHQHAASSNTNRLILFIDKGLKIFDVHELDSPLASSLHWSYTDELAPFRLEILASCEFFLLINLYRNHGLALLNPSTGTYYKIPYPPFYSKHHECYGIYLDEANHDCKIVVTKKWIIPMFFEDDDNVIETNMEVRVYNLRTNKWRLIERKLDNLYYIWRDPAAVIRHLLHTLFLSSSEDSSVKDRIGCFDILAEKWINDVPFPHLNDFERTKLTVLDGLLCLTALNKGETGSRNYVVWVMKEYGVKDSWFKIMSITSNESLYLDFYPIAYRTGSRHEVLCRRISNGECIWYNVRERKTTTGAIEGNYGYICKGSLFDLSGNRNMKLLRINSKSPTIV